MGIFKYTEGIFGIYCQRKDMAYIKCKKFRHKNFAQGNFGRFFMKFWTIKEISDEYNLTCNFRNVTHFENLQNVTVYAKCF